MHKNKFLRAILIFVMAFFTLFSFSISKAATSTTEKETIVFDGRTITQEEILERIEELRTNNPLEMALSEFILGFGDSVMEEITFIYKEQITIDKIVFNDVVSINADFFELSKGEIETTNATRTLCGIINNWYSVFNGIAIIAYMLMLIYVGIQTVLRHSKCKSKSAGFNIKMDDWNYNFIFISICNEIFF